MKRFFTHLKISSFSLVAIFVLLVGQLGWGQTSYLGLDGGFEGSATINNTTVQTAPQSGSWTKANATQTITNETVLVRSGSNSLRTTNGTTGRRIWSPNISVSSTTSSVTIQYYRLVTNTTNTQETQQGIQNNTEGLSGTYATPATANTWEKVTYNKASSTFTSVAGVILSRSIGTGGNIYIDDVCVYTGAVDNTAPSASTSPSATVATTTSMNVSWTAASGGVDGGGYLVVRGTSDPATTPNANGIYAVGNTIAVGETVAYIGTSTSFTDAGLTGGLTYYYRIYTVDKAFNYSSAVSVNRLLCPSITATFTGATTICSGLSTNLSVAVTGGTSPYTLTLDNGGGNATSTTPVTKAVSPTTMTAYTATVVDANSCPTTVSGNTQTVNVNPTPTASVLANGTGATTICKGSTSNLKVTITGGTSPYTLVITSAGTKSSYISGSDLTDAPMSTTMYSLTSVTDANGCMSTGLSGTPTITVDQPPTTSVAGSNQTLSSSSFTMAANAPTVGTGAWTVFSHNSTTTPMITDPSSPTTMVTGISSSKMATLRWTISNGTCTASASDAVLTNSTVLTAELTSLKAKAQNSQNHITWQTVTEKNTHSFDVERSANGLSNWQTLGTVKAAGHSQTVKDYQFIDDAPLSISYYRLRSVDMDGTETKSNVVSISQGKSTKLTVYPSTVSDKLMVSTDNDDVQTYIITDLLGRNVQTGQFRTQTELSVGTLAKGIYMVKVGTETAKFWKQ